MSHQNKSSEFVKRRVITFSFKKYGCKLVWIIRRVVTIFSTIMSKNVSKRIGLLSGSGTCAWWTKGRTNLAFMGEQNFWHSPPSPAWQVRVFYARTPSNCLLTSDVNSDVVAIAFTYCLFDFTIHSAPFFCQTRLSTIQPPHYTRA